MRKKKKKLKLRRSAVRIMSALFAISLSMIVFDSLRRDFFKVTNDDKIVVEGEFISKTNPPIPPSTVAFNPNSRPTNTAVAPIKNAGFTDENFSSDRLSQGLLAIAGESGMLSVDNPEKTVNLSETHNEFYTVEGDNVMLNAEAAEALNQLMADYNKATELADFVVYGTTNTYTAPDSVCPRYFAERSNGCTVDLALLGVGSYINFDGLDAEGWVVENCAKYGFIVRYPEGKSQITGESYCPWHLRYVGRLHADIMTEQNMCLEEYIDFLKGYGADKPYTHSVGGTAYVLYSAESTGDTTSVKIPISGIYDCSGDNRGTYIISYER